MKTTDNKSVIHPLIVGSAVFIATLLLTQYLAYQQYLIIKEKEKDGLLYELLNVRDRFNNILDTDRNKANTLSILFDEIEEKKEFDTIVKRIAESNINIDIIELVHNDIVTHVYPLKGNENLLGLNTAITELQREENRKAIERKGPYFAGPRKLTQGDYAILSKFPLYKDKKIKAICILLTKLSTLKKALHTTNSQNSIFHYVLAKKDQSNKYQDFKLTDNSPSKETSVESVEIPDGEWKLKVSYSQNYEHDNSYFLLSGFGLLLALLSGFAIYRRTREKTNLQLGIREKTQLLNERVKELSTIYKINDLLLDEKQSIDEMFTKMADLLPSGFQYPEICEAKITFDGKDYTSENYQKSEICQTQNIHLADGRKGQIEVVYTTKISELNESAFLKEEYDLIQSAANHIETYLNKAAQKEALLLSETHLRAAFEKASIGMGIVSLEGSWLIVNKPLCEMLGYTEKELLSLTFQQITHPDDLEKDLEFFKKILNGETDSYDMDKRYIHKNGAIIWIHLNVAAVKDQNNKIIYFVSQIENVTERVESQTKFKDLVEKSQVGVYILKDNKFVYVNPKIIEKFGYTEEELIGFPGTIIIYEDDVPHILEKLKERKQGKTDDLNYEVRLQKKDSSLVWAEVFSSTTIYNGELAVIGTIIDRTEEKNLELERQKIVTDLTVRNQELEQFSYIVSHNMRAPIANLIGLCNLLENEVPEEDQKIINQSINKSALLLDGVVNDVTEILDLKKDFLQTKTEINLDKKVEKIKNNLGKIIKESQAKIDCDFTAINTINSVPTYIHSIFFNLISNSLTHSCDDIAPEIKIWSEKNKDSVKIHFKDNGTGIDLTRYGKHIFGLYKKFNTKKKGKGLGLFMVKNQVNALNGSIEVKSEPNVGTTFIVTLPLD